MSDAGQYDQLPLVYQPGHGRSDNCKSAIAPLIVRPAHRSLAPAAGPWSAFIDGPRQRDAH
eukprot:5295548-Pyramimonas_sp.AAC.1